jgi:hypothetical protein
MNLKEAVNEIEECLEREVQIDRVPVKVLISSVKSQIQKSEKSKPSNKEERMQKGIKLIKDTERFLLRADCCDEDVDEALTPIINATLDLEDDCELYLKFLPFNGYGKLMKSVLVEDRYIGARNMRLLGNIIGHLRLRNPAIKSGDIKTALNNKFIRNFSLSQSATSVSIVDIVKNHGTDVNFEEYDQLIKKAVIKL